MFKILTALSLTSTVEATNGNEAAASHPFRTGHAERQLNFLRDAKITPAVASSEAVEPNLRSLTATTLWLNSVDFNEKTCTVAGNTNGKQYGLSNAACITDSKYGQSYMATTCTVDSASTVSQIFNVYNGLVCAAPSIGTVTGTHPACSSNGDKTWSTYSCSTGDPKPNLGFITR